MFVARGTVPLIKYLLFVPCPCYTTMLSTVLSPRLSPAWQCCKIFNNCTGQYVISIQYKLETPVPLRTLMQLGPRFALEWVTIEWLNVDAVRIHSAKINLTSRQKSGACCGWSECNGFCQAIGYISKAQKSDILVQIPLYNRVECGNFF